MNIDTLALNMHNALASRIRTDLPHDEYEAARMARAVKAFELAGAVSASERARALASAEAFVARGVTNGTVELALLADVARLLDGKKIPNFTPPGFGADEEVVHAGESVAPSAKCELNFRLVAGHGLAPTSFLRTAAFTSQLEGVQVFDVLGMPGVKVERGTNPLTESHLAVTMFLLSRVTTYDPRLGAEVAFKPWDAVRVLGWSQSTQSLKRLIRLCDDLRAATIRIAHKDAFDSTTAASLISSHTTSLAVRRENWTAVLPAPLIDALQNYRTFVKFETLAALPRGVTTMLYLFLRSEKSRESEWDEDALAAMVGLTSQSAVDRRRKLNDALELLQIGVHFVMPRGKAVGTVERCEVIETKKGLKLRAIGEAAMKRFKPVVEAFAFKKGQDGSRRVSIVKA